MKLAVIGCGSMGRRRIRHLQRMGFDDLVACDIRQDRREEVTAQFGIPTIADPDALVAHRPEAIIISVPPAMHLGYIELAVDQGWHLMTEQPVAHRLEGLDDLLAKIRAKGLVTHVSCNKRFHPAVNQIKQMIADGTIGTPLAGIVEIGEWLPDWHPYEPYTDYYPSSRAMGGGLDAICDLDWLIYLFGMPQRFTAMASRRTSLAIDTEDVVQLLLDFPSGPQVFLHSDMIQRVFSFTIKLIGEAATLTWSRAEHRFHLFEAATGQWRVLDEKPPANFDLYASKPGWEWVEPVYFKDTGQFVERLKRRDPATDSFVSGMRNLDIVLQALAIGRGCRPELAACLQLPTP